MTCVKKLSLCAGVSALSLALFSCGGGGGSAAPTRPTTPPPTTTPTTPPASDAWEPGVFANSDQFVAQCEVPRTGADEFTGEAFPDQQGTAFDEKMWLRSWTHETYLWYDEVPDNNPDDFSIPAFFAQLKTTETTPSGKPKDNFHFSEPTSEYQERTQSGTSSGYGISWEFVANTAPRELRVRYTEPGSPAAEQGIPRGARLTSIDGIDFVTTTVGSEIDAINEALFPAEVGSTHTFDFEDVNGQTLRATLSSEVIALKPVQNVRTIETAAGRVGYLQFNTFITPAQSDLINAFQSFENAGINELVIDLRYNTGGSIALSSQLGFMVAGTSQTNNRTFSQLVYNDKTPPEPPFPFYNREIDYVNGVFTNNPLPSPELDRVFILSTQDTCSASESLINGLKGINVDVVLIGDKTCGKPFGFLPTDNCGTTYYTIQFTSVNAKGFGEYADGFIPTANPQFQDELPGCSIADDFTHALGNEDEALLSAALYYAQNGQCPAIEAPASASSERLKAKDGIAIKAPNRFVDAIIADDFTPVKQGEME